MHDLELKLTAKSASDLIHRSNTAPFQAVELAGRLSVIEMVLAKLISDMPNSENLKHDICTDVALLKAAIKPTDFPLLDEAFHMSVDETLRRLTNLYSDTIAS